MAASSSQPQQQSSSSSSGSASTDAVVADLDDDDPPASSSWWSSSSSSWSSSSSLRLETGLPSTTMTWPPGGNGDRRAPASAHRAWRMREWKKKSDRTKTRKATPKAMMTPRSTFSCFHEPPISWTSVTDGGASSSWAAGAVHVVSVATTLTDAVVAVFATTRQPFESRRAPRGHVEAHLLSLDLGHASSSPGTWPVGLNGSCEHDAEYDPTIDAVPQPSP
mmetsp:Transcript_5615/g.23339  ORF Transcript_5615/g.23339 Transcript_5615/m.23339 type:complete len:221 (-) Transcript_5615:217-879(-)